MCLANPKATAFSFVAAVFNSFVRTNMAILSAARSSSRQVNPQAIENGGLMTIWPMSAAHGAGNTVPVRGLKVCPMLGAILLTNSMNNLTTSIDILSAFRRVEKKHLKSAPGNAQARRCPFWIF